MIISVSRRCDIPRFQFDWFIERLYAGFAEAVNPYNPNQIRRVSLLSEDAEVLVFWTRDPRHILAQAERLGEWRFYVMITLTGYPFLLEPSAPEEGEITGAIRELAGIIGPKRLIWRYDPLVFSDCTDEDFHQRNFKRLTGALKASVGRVIISLYDEYAGARRRIARMEKEGRICVFPWTDGDGRLLPRTRALLAALAEIAGAAGLPVYSCAEGEELGALGIQRGACIDSSLIEELWGLTVGGKDRNQRPQCGCATSVDIGRYGDCPAGCVYCYASR